MFLGASGAATGGGGSFTNPLLTGPYAAVQWGDGVAAYSTNSGTSWTSLSPNGGNGNYGFTSSGDRFVFPAYTGTQIVWNSTFTSSVSGTLGGYGGMRAFRSAGTGTIMCRVFGTGLFRSTNGGSTFTKVFDATGSFNSGLHCGLDGVWFHTDVNIGVTPRTQQYYISQDDGITWTQTTSGLPATSASAFNGFSGYMNGKHHAWIPSASTGSELYTSLNGITWTLVGTKGAGPYIGDNYGNLYSVIYISPYYWCTYSNTVYRSSNGITWSAFSAPTGLCQGLGYANGVFIYVLFNGTNTGTVYTSTDPSLGSSSWTLRYTATTTAYGMAQGLNQNSFG
jgi:hypothetical protein